MAELNAEEEWLVSDEPGRLVDMTEQPDYPRVREYSERKFRLWSCACCRHIWPLMTFANSRDVISLAERYADGLATQASLERAAEQLSDALGTVPIAEASLRPECWAGHTAGYAAWSDGRKCHGNKQGAGYVPMYVWDAVYFDAGGDALSEAERTKLWEKLDRTLCELLRDIFGNPFRPVAFEPAWLTSTVVSRTAAIYADRAFDRLPVLADALQDAGCEDADILGHCRGPGPHVRGCWVVDLVLGKN